MSKRNRSEKILERLSSGLDIPPAAITGLVHIEAEGNREITVDGCKGVLEYSENSVRLNTGKLVVRICGAQLTITMLQNGQAVIKGDITGIEFCN